MNLALLIGQRPASLHALESKLSGLGLRVTTCSDISTPSNVSIVPRVLMLDADAGDALTRPLPASIADTPIRLAISPFGIPIAGAQQIIMPPVTEEALIRALLKAGYDLPAAAECTAIPALLHELADGDRPLVLELIDSLIESGESDLGEYQAHCAAGDWAAAGALAHRIKGTTRTVGCASLTRLCERIESAARTETGSTLMWLNQIFEPGVRRLCAALRGLKQDPGSSPGSQAGPHP